MSFTPGRGPLVYNQPGNPLYSQPNLTHPQTNPSGLLPGTPTIPRGVEAWSDYQTQRFASDGTNQVWTWESPVFDCRPALSAAYGTIASAVPINNEPGLGQAISLNIIIGESSGATPPASTVGLTGECWEDGNVVNSDNAQLIRLTQAIPITDTILAGGTTTTAPFGGSGINVVPCMSGLRFWKVSIRLTIAGVAAITRPYFIQSSLH